MSFSARVKKYSGKHIMMLPVVIITILFSYIPLVGIVLAFQNYSPVNGFFGSEWVGFQHFKDLFELPDFGRIIRNTVIISSLKMIAGIVFALIFALCMNEINHRGFKSSVQALTLFPHFISWVVLGSIFLDVFASDGMANQVLLSLGLSKVEFLTDGNAFRGVLIATDVWKGFAYNSIIYMSALSGIDTGLYEAAYLDGAGKWKSVWHITLPSIGQIIAMTAILSVAGILSAGFDQVYNMYNPMVMESADILDTYVYRVGLTGGQYSFGTAVGLFKSLIGAILFAISNWAAYKYTDYRIL